MQSAAVILVGGFSRRFGGDKARYVWRGRQFVEHISTAMGEVCDELVLVVRPDQLDQKWPTPSIVSDDLSLPPGPLRGIISGLEAIQSEIAFVTACDSPVIVPALAEGVIAHLLAQSASPTSPVVPEWGGRLQPLLAAYPVSISPRLREIAISGEQSITRAIRQLNPIILSENECRSLDPAGLSFLNINTPEDLSQLENIDGCSA